MKYFEVVLVLPNDVELFLGTVRAECSKGAMNQATVLYPQEIAEHPQAKVTVQPV